VPSGKVETARKDRNRRTAGRVLENLGAFAPRIRAIDDSRSDPRLRAVAGTRERYRALQRRRRSADGVLIDRVRS